MGVRFSFRVTAAAVLLACAGCSNAPHDSGCCVQWVALVESSVRSGVEIQLDGQSVYQNGSASQLVNRTELVRSADDREHVFEFRILAAESEPATYTASVTIQRSPGGDFEFLHSEPAALHVGDRISVRVPN